MKYKRQSKTAEQIVSDAMGRRIKASGARARSAKTHDARRRAQDDQAKTIRNRAHFKNKIESIEKKYGKSGTIKRGSKRVNPGSSTQLSSK